MLISYVGYESVNQVEWYILNYINIANNLQNFLQSKQIWLECESHLGRFSSQSEPSQQDSCEFKKVKTPVQWVSGPRCYLWQLSLYHGRVPSDGAGIELRLFSFFPVFPFFNWLCYPMLLLPASFGRSWLAWSTATGSFRLLFWLCAPLKVWHKNKFSRAQKMLRKPIRHTKT